MKEEQHKQVLTNIKTGKYQHFKGMMYEVIGTSLHSETLKEFVIYKQLYGDGGVWIRPIEMFFENITLDGKETPRFKYLGSDQKT